jgi:hypothetical protein
VCSKDKGWVYAYFSRIHSIERIRFNKPIMEEDVFLLTEMKDFLKNFDAEANFNNIEAALATI